MRKITKEVVGAFMRHEKKANGNTLTANDALFLHGNKIAEWRGNELWVCSGGWKSATTKERLNGIPQVALYQNAGRWFLNEKEWDGHWIAIN